MNGTWILIIAFLGGSAGPGETKVIKGFESKAACDNAADMISIQWSKRYDSHVCIPNKILIPGSEK